MFSRSSHVSCVIRVYVHEDHKDPRPRAPPGPSKLLRADPGPLAADLVVIVDENEWMNVAVLLWG